MRSTTGKDRKPIIIEFRRTDQHETEIQRLIVIVLDGVGAGEAPDAADYGDVGSNSLGNTARVVGRAGSAQHGAISGWATSPR